MTSTPYYSSCLTLDRVRLMVSLGREAGERSVKQPVELTIRLYFAEPVAPCFDDNDSQLLCYAHLSTSLEAFISGREFRLIEYLNHQCYLQLRSLLPQDVKLWVKLHKVEAPVPTLKGGASFIYTDLPAGAACLEVV